MIRIIHYVSATAWHDFYNLYYLLYLFIIIFLRFFKNTVTMIFLKFCFWKYIKIIFFFIFKKLFLISIHQNNLKTLKIILILNKK
jgi:hypothetical protein